MAPSIAQVHERIALQKSALPVMYGDVDFSATPERYTERVEESSLPKSLRHLPPPPRPRPCAVRQPQCSVPGSRVRRVPDVVFLRIKLPSGP